jgi:hypothetical protein
VVSSAERLAGFVRIATIAVGGRPGSCGSASPVKNRIGMLRRTSSPATSALAPAAPRLMSRMPTSICVSRIMVTAASTSFATWVT